MTTRDNTFDEQDEERDDVIDDGVSICPDCAGSGEGASDGAHCYKCKGAGETGRNWMRP